MQREKREYELSVTIELCGYEKIRKKKINQRCIPMKNIRKTKITANKNLEISSTMAWKAITATRLLVIVLILFFNLKPGLMTTPTGALSVIDVAGDDFKVTTPQEISEKSTSIAIHQAEIEIAQMKEKNFSITLAEDALVEAKREWAKSNFANVSALTQFISYLNKEKTDFADKLVLIEEERRQAEEEGVTVDKVRENLLLAQDSSAKDQIQEARDYLKLARDSLDVAKIEQERVQLMGRFKKNFFIRNWWEILLGIAVVGVLFVPVLKKYRVSMLSWKISSLQIELKKIDGQIRQLQTDYFVDRKIPLSTYKLNVVRLEERMAELKHTLPVLEEQKQRLKDAKNIFSFKSREKKMNVDDSLNKSKKGLKKR